MLDNVEVLSMLLFFITVWYML